jgi:hypothetical protein
MPGLVITPDLLLPPGFPLRLKGPLVWSESDFKNHSEYVFSLNQDEIGETRKALRHSQGKKLLPDIISLICTIDQGLGLSICRDIIGPSNFPLHQGYRQS